MYSNKEIIFKEQIDKSLSYIVTKVLNESFINEDRKYTITIQDCINEKYILVDVIIDNWSTFKFKKYDCLRLVFSVIKADVELTDHMLLTIESSIKNQIKYIVIEKILNSGERTN